MSPGKLERRREREKEGKRGKKGALLNLEMSSKHCGRADKEKAPQEEETVLVTTAVGVVNILSLRVSDVRGKLK